MKIADLIKEKRLALGESQAVFGKRFNAVANTVSRWENGVYNVPNSVIEALFDISLNRCNYCKGKGFLVEVNKQ